MEKTTLVIRDPNSESEKTSTNTDTKKNSKNSKTKVQKPKM